MLHQQHNFHDIITFRDAQKLIFQFFLQKRDVSKRPFSLVRHRGCRSLKSEEGSFMRWLGVIGPPPTLDSGNVANAELPVYSTKIELVIYEFKYDRLFFIQKRDV